MINKLKTPQEKKALSYAKDCRNVYGENDKSSRKNVALRKAQSHRAFRKKISDVLQHASEIKDVEASELLESEVKSIKKSSWKKDNDLPLGEFIKRQLAGRKRRAGNGKMRRKRLRDTNLETQGLNKCYWKSKIYTQVSKAKKS